MRAYQIRATAGAHPGRRQAPYTQHPVRGTGIPRLRSSLTSALALTFTCPYCRVVGSSILLVLLAALVGGCSLPFLPSSITSSSVTACPSPVPFQTVRGMIQSINGTTLLITATNGNTVKATYTSTTRFTLEASATTAALQQGTFVFVAVTQNASNIYPTATRISLLNAAPGSRTGGAFGGGFGRRSGSACGGRGLRGGFGGQDFAGGNGNTRGIAGTVSQLRGSSLTVTDMNQANFTVILNSSTQIVKTSQVSASSLQVGTQVNLIGLRNAQGVITARSVMILLPGSGA